MSQSKEVVYDLPTLEKEIGIPLPPGTRVMLVERESGVDDLIRAKFQMKRALFEQIVSRLPVKLEDLSPGAGRLGTDRGDWDPHRTAGLKTAQAALPNARYVNLGVADDSKEIVTLFVVNHGT